MKNPTVKKWKEIKGFIGYKAFKKDKKGIYTDGHGSGKRIDWKKGDKLTFIGEIGLCSAGYHCFRHMCFAIDYFCKNNDIYEVIIKGDVHEDTEKIVCSELEIKRKLTKREIKKMIDTNYNSGDYNSGYYNSGYYNSGDRNLGDGNSGDYNSGNYNSGNYNSGNCNSGNCNSGYSNSGYYNSGGCNSGNYNSGNCNSGDYNSGNRNSGNCNSGDYNSGVFCSDEPNARFFNKESNIKMSDWINSDSYCLIQRIEIKSKKLDYVGWWKNLNDDERETIKKLPNFDNKVFKEITGIEL